MTDKTDPSATSAPENLVLERLFDAPRNLVWTAWTEPERMKQWWGPKNFTAPVVQMDFRVGGKYLYCMRSTDGQEIWGTGTYVQIVPMERIVFTDSFADEMGNVVRASYYGMGDDFPLEMTVTVTFEALDGKTKMTLRHSGLPAGKIIDMTGTGWNESFDKLAALLK